MPKMTFRRKHSGVNLPYALHIARQTIDLWNQVDTLAVLKSMQFIAWRSLGVFHFDPAQSPFLKTVLIEKMPKTMQTQ